jgi:SAM-dependent methyltransferase
MTTRSEWTEYYDEHEGREPREMLLEVLDAFGAGEERSAVDLGCGSGIDTLAMLLRGWRVFAIDAEEEAIERVRRRVPGTLSSRLTTVVSRMEDIDLPTGVDLVWASFSLFFCRPDSFGEVWSRIDEAIAPGGRFAGELLGDRDTWAPEDDISAFTRDQAVALFNGFEVERFDEEEEDGRATSEEKHWHLFHAVARRPDTASAPGGTSSPRSAPSTTTAR